MTAGELAEKIGLSVKYIENLARRGVIGESFPRGVNQRRYEFTSLDLERLKLRQQMPKYSRNRA